MSAAAVITVAGSSVLVHAMSASADPTGTPTASDVSAALAAAKRAEAAAKRAEKAAARAEAALAAIRRPAGGTKGGDGRTTPAAGGATAGTPGVPATPLTKLPANALLVGPGHTYAKPCQAIRAAKAGAVIGIDAKGNGSYDGDVCSWSTDRLTIIGYGGRARVDAAGRNADGKATWVISGRDTRIENVELSGATVPDQNGAAIRAQGANLTIVHCYFHHNQNGLLTTDDAGNVVVDSTEFARNGIGDGRTHNMYINHVKSFTLRYSYSHDANIGHLVKSRALKNYIFYNRLTGESGSDSYELDLPNGGTSYVVGNVLQQGPRSDNPALFAYGEEGSLNPDSRLYVVNNTVVDGRGRGRVLWVGGDVTAPVLFQDNVVTGTTDLVTQVSAVVRTNCVTGAPRFSAPATYDYRLLAGSPCLKVGSAAPRVDGISLAPVRQYVHPVASAARPAAQRGFAGAFGRAG